MQPRLCEDRGSQKQVDVLQALKKKARERQLAFIHGPHHEGASKLKELEQQVLRDAEQLSRIERRQMARHGIVGAGTDVDCDSG